jgi:hypothetical protein
MAPESVDCSRSGHGTECTWPALASQHHAHHAHHHAYPEQLPSKQDTSISNPAKHLKGIHLSSRCKLVQAKDFRNKPVTT